MIEKYFLQGVRFTWAGSYDAPPGNMDGSIIANPTPPSRPMVYESLDGELMTTSLTNVSALGFRKGMSIPYSWLSYAVGHTTKKMLAAGDVLTGFMSGCPIALWQENGIRYAGHVGTYDANPTVNDRVRRKFALSMPRDVIGFNPAGAWQPGEIATLMRSFKTVTADPKVLALVTTGGEFYSILVFRLMFKTGGPAVAHGSYCVGGAKRVAPLNYEAMQRWLLPTMPALPGVPTMPALPALPGGAMMPALPGVPTIGGHRR
jgi:hypothetical protein